ncbi:1-deoxy-D-xylulose-5-phosphate reductoisomerase [Magnetovibrio sp. PR-2]|uniref:1-deoxy-D-xylulose-5-phosphate reductoisomerase n=1 Tax=Magnetovibrio sp. PR-2 TaxID=3120356 RepID=UPI002FCE2347
MAVVSASPKPQTAPRSVTVLGSTGSIGTSTVDLLKRNPSDFVVEALTGNRNVQLLAAQAKELGAKQAVVADESLYGELKDLLFGTSIEAAAGDQAVSDAAARPSDIVLASIVGTAGLKPTLEAARRGALVALANKETLVSAGQVMTAEVQKGNATLIPVDSEHSAIFQVFDFERPEGVAKITLTASGGPFREKSLDEMSAMTPDEAVAHPNWDMGAKISIDSASMMNKGLEMIEAFHLFPISADQIEVLVHPQSVVHSTVSYVDGSVLAQMGTPDMRTPIAYALAWPQRMAAPSEPLDLSAVGTLTFEAPDLERFPALRLAGEALRAGGSVPTVLNAANEVAVAGFLDEKIGFLEIARTVEAVMDMMGRTDVGSLDEVFDIDAEARLRATALVAG